jgi:K+-transporting ATPase KdpF subunit
MTENLMHVETLIMLAVCVLVGAYLFYALLRPEKF